jgi:hypothetical protein
MQRCALQRKQRNAVGSRARIYTIQKLLNPVVASRGLPTLFGKELEPIIGCPPLRSLR